MGTLEQKWGPWNKNGDPKTEKGPHGDPVPQMGTHVASVLLTPTNPPTHRQSPKNYVFWGRFSKEILECFFNHSLKPVV